MPELPNPNARSLANLKKIAAKISERLPQIPIEDIWMTSYGYSCDEAGNVTGLNLREIIMLTCPGKNIIILL